MRVALNHSDAVEQATKSWWINGEHIVIRCPQCHRIGSLNDHKVDTDGQVEPSLVCPHECGFHERVLLLDWPPDLDFGYPDSWDLLR
jgi:hypothetical protein